MNCPSCKAPLVLAGERQVCSVDHAHYNEQAIICSGCNEAMSRGRNYSATCTNCNHEVTGIDDVISSGLANWAGEAKAA